MLTFFRHFRKSLLSSGQAQRYLLYAIGEIALVVIGILIALQVNNWNEERKDHTIQKKYLLSFLSDLRRDSIILHHSIKDVKSLQDGYTNYVFTMYKTQASTEEFVDLISSQTWPANAFILNDNTYSEMTSSGNLNLIHNDLLKQSIIEYYKEYQVAASSIEQMNRSGLDIFLQVYPLLAKYFKGSFFDNSIVVKYEEDWQFINNPRSKSFKILEASASHYSFKSSVQEGFYTDLLQKAKNIMMLIKGELGESE